MGREMNVRETAFLVLLLLGILALLCGVLWTRLNWRPDIPPYGRHTRSLDVTLHPARYAAPHSLPAIRILNVIGAVLLAGATVVLIREVLSSITGR